MSIYFRSHPFKIVHPSVSLSPDRTDSSLDPPTFSQLKANLVCVGQHLLSSADLYLAIKRSPSLSPDVQAGFEFRAFWLQNFKCTGST